MIRNPEQLTQHLENMITAARIPGCAVCIRGPEGIIYEHGFGRRSVLRNTPANPDTIFGIASMSKSLTALSICILACEGKLDPDDPISKYFPKLHVPGVPDELITLRQIALHRAGFAPMEPLEWSIAMNTEERESEWHTRMVQEAPNRMDSIDQIVDYISEGRYPALGEPGEYMSYSNEGFALLSYVVDMAAGIPLEQFLDERIFRPLGMDRSILDLDCSDAKKIAGDDNITSLFEEDENGTIHEDDAWSVLPPYRGCACVKSTARDITRYYQMLSCRGVFEGRRIIPEQAVEMLVGSEFPLRRKPFICMGLRKQLIAGKMVCSHGGALHGVSTHGGFIEGGYSCAVLSNMSDADAEAIQWVLYSYILGLPLDSDFNWCKPSGRQFSGESMLVGDYVGHEGIVSHCLVFRSGDKLLCRHDGRMEELRYCESTVFAVYSEKTGKRINTYRFFLRDGRAWAMKNGSRIFRKA